MKKTLMKYLQPACILPVFCFLFFCSSAFAQKEDTTMVPVRIVNMDTITVIKTDSGEFNHLKGNVILQQGTDTLYCDSALMNNTTHNFEGFGHVRIAQQGGTHGTSDYLKYTTQAKMAFMSGNVRMTDGKNNLDCAELTYNMGSRIAVYDKGGKLYNDSTTVTSRTGEYNIPLKQARFKHNVVIIDTQYRIKSEDVQYNTETKVTSFYAHSVVTRDSGRSVLETSDGWYDGKLGKAHFKGFSGIWNNGQYIESDSVLNYDKQTGFGLAIASISGRVISIDTGRHSRMFCGRAEYYQKQRKLWATNKPVLEQVNGKDTLYIRADTFYSAPMVRSKIQIQGDSSFKAGSRRHRPDSSLKNQKDSLDAVAYDLPVPVASTRYHVPLSVSDTGYTENVKRAGVPKALKVEKKKDKKNKKGSVELMQVASTDSVAVDTTAPLYFIGYHHVLIFSDSMQGKCDSVCYTRADSMIRMMYSPIVWSHKSQITGDTILLQLDSSTLRKMYVPNNAFVASRSGPEKAQLWDQVQGKTLTAYFDSNAVKQIIVKPDAECIYYVKDEKGAYMDVDQGSSVRMFIYFADQKMQHIKFDKEPRHVLTPLEKADLPNMRLSKFKWLDNQRPRSKEELFK